MESIKHKMDTMVKEKDAAIERAIGFEAETEELNRAAQKFEKEVDSIQREIAKLRLKLLIFHYFWVKSSDPTIYLKRPQMTQ